MTISLFKKPIFLYLALGLLIVGWWGLAFKYQFRSSSLHPTYLSISNPSLRFDISTLFPDLSPIQRDTLQRALSGDIRHMIELLTDWDVDAQILASKGIEGIKRLSAERYVQAHLLARLLVETHSADLKNINMRISLKKITDDNSHLVSLKTPFSRFLAQTYVASNFLLALGSPEQVIAIPKALRSIPHLYTKDLLNQIPHNIELFNSEQLFLAPPHLAFISHYSHPSTVQILHQQGIELYSINKIDTIAQIQEALLKVGHVSHHPLEANLLNIFMEAGLIMVDNRLRALDERAKQENIFTQALYLYPYQQHYMIPTQRCLTGQLLERALEAYTSFACPVGNSRHDWRVPFQQEQLAQCSPNCVILSNLSESSPINQCDRLFADLPAFEQHQIYSVDEFVQESPTQYIVLAYFDIFQALAAVHLP